MKEDITKEEDAGPKNEEESKKPESPEPSGTLEEPSSGSKDTSNTTDKEDVGSSDSKEKTGNGENAEEKCPSKEEGEEEDRGNRQTKETEVEVWSLEDEEKLLQFVAKVFQMNFPMYATHKQYYHGLAEVRVGFSFGWFTVLLK